MNNRKMRRSVLVVIRIFAWTFGILLILFTLLVLIWGNYRRNYCQGECPSWMREYAFAHRGYCVDENVDENSLTAFEKAVEKGYAIELDLRYTKDNIPVVSHDNNLLRMTGVDKDISALTLEELKEIAFLKSGETIPTFEEALALVNGAVPILVEIKSYHIPNDFEGKIISILKQYDGLFAIQSYNPFALNYVKERAPEITVGLLLDDVPGLPHFRPARILKDNLFGMICRPAFITYNQDLIIEHELDIYRNDKNLVFGFLYDEASISEREYLSKVDGIVFGKRKEN